MPDLVGVDHVHRDVELVHTQTAVLVDIGQAPDVGQHGGGQAGLAQGTAADLSREEAHPLLEVRSKYRLEEGANLIEMVELLAVSQL